MMHVANFISALFCVPCTRLVRQVFCFENQHLVIVRLREKTSAAILL